MNLSQRHLGRVGGQERKGLLVWTRILLMPWWARASVTAGVNAILLIPAWLIHGLGRDQHESWLYALMVQVGGIVIFGLLVAALTHNSHQAYTNALAGLDPAQRSAALHASFHGSVPVDVRVRDAVIRVNWRRLHVARFWRVFWLVPLVLVALVGPQGMRSDFDAADWFNFAVVLGFAVGAWSVSIAVKRSLEKLGQTQRAPGPAGHHPAH